MNSTPDPLLLSEQLCFPIYAVSRLITREYQPWLEKIGLTYPQYLVMMVLWESPQMTVSQIGKKLYLKSNTLTPLLKKLILKGLIYKQRSESDEREVLIRISEKGLDLKGTACGIPARLVDSIELSNDELLTMRSLMWKLLGALDTQPME